MKKLFILIVTLLPFLVIADDFSEIDIVVRETLYKQYALDQDGDLLYPMDFFEDIWGLEVDQKNPTNCDLTISGYVNKPTLWGFDTYKFWVCIQDQGDGSFNGLFAGDHRVSSK